MAREAAAHCGIQLRTSSFMSVEGGDGTVEPAYGTCQIPVVIDDYFSNLDVYFIDMHSEMKHKPLIYIGRQWLQQDNPRLIGIQEKFLLSALTVHVRPFIRDDQILDVDKVLFQSRIFLSSQCKALFVTAIENCT
eukprot:gb/GEZJ01006182.1/.p1 GENE.gb/GEZJ01006182.1/~~gb/GEZJ01006182.1/.p1  ORF type:complete len:135 (+),score=10.92 gb/GEZJ01006182.1/:238-642(+)